jgi:hypothetical protein
MERIHLFELHDQSWYPSTLRKMFQAGLGQSIATMKVFENFTPLFQDFLTRSKADNILDLCSGSGESTAVVWQDVVKSLSVDKSTKVPKLLLSDLYPDFSNYQKIKEKYPDNIDFYNFPVNALAPPADAPKVTTLFNCFHHFKPDQARAILKSAVESSNGIAIMESSGRSWKRVLLWLFILPIFSVIFSIFLLKPFRLKNLLFGLFIPILPLTIFIDTIVSDLRVYSDKELLAMLDEIGGDEFEWEIGKVKVDKTGLDMSYLFGIRKNL